MDIKLEPGLGELLRHLTELLDQGAESLYQKKSLNFRPRYTPVMRVLASHGASSVSDITHRLSITQGAVSQTVKLMLAAGLLEKQATSDARQSLFALSEQGRSLLPLLQEHWQATFQAIQALEEEISQPLRLSLSRAIAALQSRDFALRIQQAGSPPSQPETTGAAKSSSATEHFRTAGDAYARYRPDYPHKLIQVLAELCPADGLALDVGCGTGQFSTLLAFYFEHVIATDVSEQQLAHASHHPRIEYRRESAERMSLPDHSVDLIVAAQSAHWFDLERFYREVRRVAHPGAVIALISYGVPYIEDSINAQLQQFYWRQMAPFWPAERHHVETGYAELPFPFSPVTTPDLFIRRNWTRDELAGYINTWSATRIAREAGQGEIIDRFIHQLGEHWPDPVSIKRISWPISIRAGRIP